jgi:putative acyl-CoA dehydrogenase
MALEVEAATALVMRLCRSFDLAASDPHDAARARILTPAVKYWVCKTAPGLAYEAMECLGGNGYVEESLLPRLYREAPVNAIWEGSGNVMCLDVLRAIKREGDAVLTALAQEAAEVPGASDSVAFIRTALQAPDAEAKARAVVERLAILAAAAAMQAAGQADSATAYARTRLNGRAAMFGASDLSPNDVERLLDRAFPA